MPPARVTTGSGDVEMPRLTHCRHTRPDGYGQSPVGPMPYLGEQSCRISWGDDPGRARGPMSKGAVGRRVHRSPPPPPRDQGRRGTARGKPPAGRVLSRSALGARRSGPRALGDRRRPPRRRPTRAGPGWGCGHGCRRGPPDSPEATSGPALVEGGRLRSSAEGFSIWRHGRRWWLGRGSEGLLRAAAGGGAGWAHGCGRAQSYAQLVHTCPSASPARCGGDRNRAIRYRRFVIGVG